jgi:hypothetical protein
MYSLDIRRCKHCVGGLGTVSLDEADGFEVPVPAVICNYCDGAPHREHAVFVPIRWTDSGH